MNEAPLTRPCRVSGAWHDDLSEWGFVSPSCLSAWLSENAGKTNAPNPKTTKGQA